MLNSCLQQLALFDPVNPFIFIRNKRRVISLREFLCIFKNRRDMSSEDYAAVQSGITARCRYLWPFMANFFKTWICWVRCGARRALWWIRKRIKGYSLPTLSIYSLILYLERGLYQTLVPSVLDKLHLLKGLRVPGLLVFSSKTIGSAKKFFAVTDRLVHFWHLFSNRYLNSLYPKNAQTEWYQM